MLLLSLRPLSPFFSFFLFKEILSLLPKRQRCSTLVTGKSTSESAPVVGAEQQTNPAPGADNRPDPPSSVVSPRARARLLALGTTVAATILTQGCAAAPGAQSAPAQPRWLLPCAKLSWHGSAAWHGESWGSQGLVSLPTDACRCHSRSSPKQNIATMTANTPKPNLFGG